YSAVESRVAFWWAKAAYLGVPFIGSALYHFTTIALHSDRGFQKLIRLNWEISALFALLAVSSNYLVEGLFRYPWGYYPKCGWLGIPFLLFFFTVMIGNFQQYWIEYRKAETPVRKKRIGWLMLSFVIAYLGSVDYAAKFGFPVYPFGFLLILVFLTIVAIVVLRYHLIDLTPAFAATSVLNTMPNALFVEDLERNIRVVNQPACRLLGYEESELIGKPITSIVPLPLNPKYVYRYQDLSEAPLKNSAMQWRTKGGRVLEVSIFGSVVRNPDQSPAGVVWIAVDTTALRRTQGALSETTAQLARSNAEREQLELFAYVASHDLQEPLQKMIGFGALLKKQCGALLNEKGCDYVERIQAAAFRMSRLIEDLLRFSRVVTQTETPTSTVDLNDVVREVLSDLEVRVAESAATVEVGPLPTVNVDRLQIRQLFQNLISNAIKFRKKSEPVRVKIRTEAASENGFVEVAVEDSGIGFDESCSEKIFKPFERLHPRSEYEGSGVGLAICQRIVKRHGGEIIARSHEGQGATFIVKLPKHS
ncbi:MAG: PAS domain S-box protein, partial [Candidatus Omnitrophica bacterium]|nr:PAS domain S-box protein [Candidatus Omnitrophota bacterium]